MHLTLFHNTQAGSEHQGQLESNNIVLFSQNLHLYNYS